MSSISDLLAAKPQETVAQANQAHVRSCQILKRFDTRTERLFEFVYIRPEEGFFGKERYARSTAMGVPGCGWWNVEKFCRGSALLCIVQTRLLESLHREQKVSRHSHVPPPVATNESLSKNWQN